MLRDKDRPDRTIAQAMTDAVIADRLGRNVRTARERVARPAATLGNTGQAQLGCLIAQSGILKQQKQQKQQRRQRQRD
ncbi:hypothetical protein ACLMNJ_15270 [Streptomyces seoulensis]